MPLPPDRSAIRTEHRNPRSADLHTLGVRACVDLLNTENRAILDAMDAAAEPLAALIEAAEPGFARGGRLIYLGAGTSGRLGVLDASEAPPTFQVEHGRVVGVIAGGDAALKRSSESREDEPDGARPDLDALALTAGDTLVGLAAGGTTPYVLGGLALAKSAEPGLVTALICCTPIEKPEGVDHLIVLETGPEVITGSTRLKAGTATKLAINTISTTLMVRTGRVYRNLMVDLRATNDKLMDRAARIVGELTGLDRPASFALLERADRSVKHAVIMHRLNVGLDEAARLLVDAGGRLERVMGD
ncbi:MAG: N-acetylmuramic acid 6-phosphate etherase [Phycisphaeraceae bacterium]|nr:MAG: N-acetylmuramic acid 6-phosphate etherase [Phycisphaeraceae bacterium]